MQSPVPKALRGKLLKSLAALKSVPGLVVDVAGADWTDTLVRGAPLPEPAGLSTQHFTIEEIPDAQLRLSAPAGMALELAEITVRAVLDRLEVERREESLLDELGANWESLEALYEISTDVLRFGDVNSALKRLIYHRL